MISFSLGTFLDVLCSMELIISTSIFTFIKLLSWETWAVVVLVVINWGLTGWGKVNSKSPFLSNISVYEAVMRKNSDRHTRKLTTLTFEMHVRLIKHNSGKPLMSRFSGVFACLKSRNVLIDLFPKLSVSGKLWSLWLWSFCVLFPCLLSFRDILTIKQSRHVEIEGRQSFYQKGNASLQGLVLTSTSSFVFIFLGQMPAEASCKTETLVQHITLKIKATLAA